MHKNKHPFILLTLFSAGILFLPAGVYAQDSDEFGTLNPEFGINENYNSEEKLEIDDKLITKPEEIKSKIPTKTTSPATSSKKNFKNSEKKSNSSTSGSKGEETESVLSFNFLYYMIQKFKFNDVINQ